MIPVPLKNAVTIAQTDGDIFWGHAIEINIDEDGTIEDADIAG